MNLFLKKQRGVFAIIPQGLIPVDVKEKAMV